MHITWMESDKRVSCVQLLATKDGGEGTVEEERFHLTVGSTVFAAEVHTIKEAISDALRKNLG